MVIGWPEPRVIVGCPNCGKKASWDSTKSVGYIFKDNCVCGSDRVVLYSWDEREGETPPREWHKKDEELPRDAEYIYNHKTPKSVHKNENTNGNKLIKRIRNTIPI